jgi:hypothetical protein
MINVKRRSALREGVGRADAGSCQLPPVQGTSALAFWDQSAPTEMTSAFQRYFRCSTSGPAVASGRSLRAGYFSFEGSVCYGRCAGVSPSATPDEALPSVSVVSDGGEPTLPFEPCEIVENLQRERYVVRPASTAERLTASPLARAAYYLARPLLGVGVRRHFQRIRLAGWESIPFPHWPVDVTVQAVMESVLKVALVASGEDRIPFVWFWPEGAESCAVMTHDVEGEAGRAFCEELVDLDASFGIRSAFQLVPEWLSGPSDSLIGMLRRGGCEINVHDLTHDGSLFRDRERFAEHAAEINRHARELGCRGFRAGAMYREQDWYEALDLAYDMSVPNVAHLEAQRGGCCTVMPYFVGRILELPLTTTQDYSLFHILNDYSTTLWERQVDMIRARNGLITFITHPDYLIDRRARAVYVDLLRYLANLRDQTTMWMALPAEVDSWWRDRDRMCLVRSGAGWRVEGPGSQRARIAYASLSGGSLVYEIDSTTPV